MKITLATTKPEKQLKSCLIVGIYEGKTPTPTAKLLNTHIKKILDTHVFEGKVGQTLPLFHVGNSGYEQILLVGCGKEKEVTAGSFRKIVKAALKSTLDSGTPTATCYLTDLSVEDHDLPWQVKQIAELATDSLYRFDMFKSKKEPKIALKELTIHIETVKDQKKCESALRQGVAIANGMALTKNLANTPSNICTPTFLADQAKDLAKSSSRLTAKILNEKEMKKLGMGALLAVSQGSAEEAKLICVEYKGAPASKKPVALVGKGITFDTGGNSIKPADSMVGMKYDMCGAATVLGAIKAAAELKLPVNVVGIIAAVENMPGGTAYKPEDILTSMSGQTIEVISTDAEGRLVLADALTYCERYKPDVVIDIATLTGAVVIALGFHATGLISNNEKLTKDLLKAGNQAFDRAWQLPLWDEFQEQIKSPFADMANTGGRSGGTITAGCFLSRFAKKYHWAHLDVAGTAAMMMGTGDRYATGRPVPMLVQYLIDRAN